MLISVCSFCLFAQSSPTKEEYAVYGRVLRDIRLENLKQTKAKYSFVILDDTFKPEHFCEYKSGRFRSLSKDFKRKNLTSSKLEKSFPVSYAYEITSQAQIDELLKIGKKNLKELKQNINFVTLELPVEAILFGNLFMKSIQMQTVITDFQESVSAQTKGLLWCRLKDKEGLGAV